MRYTNFSTTKVLKASHDYSTQLETRMAFTQDQESPKFIFGEQEYNLDSLSPEQIAIIQSIKSAEQKIAPLQSELLLLSRGREALIEDLRQLLTEE